MTHRGLGSAQIHGHEPSPLCQGSPVSSNDCGARPSQLGAARKKQHMKQTAARATNSQGLSSRQSSRVGCVQKWRTSWWIHALHWRCACRLLLAAQNRFAENLSRPGDVGLSSSKDVSGRPTSSPFGRPNGRACCWLGQAAARPRTHTCDPGAAAVCATRSHCAHAR